MQCMVAGEARNLVAQIRRGVLPYCVLAMLRNKEQYGFELVHALGGIDGMVTGEGTIYPLLARLRRQGLVETTWQESATGPPRKYYRLAEAGQDAPAVLVAPRFGAGLLPLLVLSLLLAGVAGPILAAVRLLRQAWQAPAAPPADSHTLQPT
jgi:PadR family transcriptional regulator, regulatory protein PadR